MYTEIEISCKDFTYIWFLSNCEQITTLLAKPNSSQQSNTVSFRTYSFWEETILPVAYTFSTVSICIHCLAILKAMSRTITLSLLSIWFPSSIFQNFVLQKVLSCGHTHNRMNSYSNDFIKLLFQNKDNSKVYYLLLSMNACMHMHAMYAYVCL